MRPRKIMLCFGLLLACLWLAAGCGEYGDEIKTINAAVEKLAEPENGHLQMTALVRAEEARIGGFDAAYLYDYHYRIDVRSFNFLLEKRDLATGEPLEPPYKVIEAHKYDAETGAEDEEYNGKIGDFPDLLSFYFGAGLKSGYVGSVEPLDAAEAGLSAEWRGWRVHKNEKYVGRVNSSRGKSGAAGVMLENYVDYWLDGAGVLVRMDYVSRDAIEQAGENGAPPTEDILQQHYTFELLSYNRPENADF